MIAELRIDERLAEQLRRHVEPVLLLGIDYKTEPFARAARASVKSFAAQVRREAVCSFSGSKRG